MLARVAQALRDVERVARIAGLACERLLQHARVVEVFVAHRAATTRAIGKTPHAQRVELRQRRVARRERGVLVQHALPAPRPVVTQQLRAPVFERRIGEALAHVVTRRVERRRGRRRIDLEHFVRIDHERVIAVAARELERLVAVRREVDPGPLDQLARQVREQLAHDPLRAVVRTGVDDRPRADRGTHGREAARDDGRFVAHDHAEAQPGSERQRSHVRYGVSGNHGRSRW